MRSFDEGDTILSEGDSPKEVHLNKVAFIQFYVLTDRPRS